MDAMLVSVSTLSGIAAGVFGLLFVVDLIGMVIYVSRSGHVEPEEGQVVTENRSRMASDSIELGGTGALGGRYWGKHKVFFSRSAYISDLSLVDGTATKAQRRLVRAIQLAAVLFWLMFACGALTLLPSQPALALFFAIFITGWFLFGVRLVLKGRAEALRKLKERQESRQDRRHKA
jgi:hypothetical protein